MEKWAELGVLGVEMEAYALYVAAAETKKKALAIMTVTDSFLSQEKLSAEERQIGLANMVETAISTAEEVTKCLTKCA